jgi:hypothetical protein
MKSFHYDLIIQTDALEILTKMLSINPIDRYKITDFYKGDICNSPIKIQNRGSIYRQCYLINISTYYKVVDWIIGIAEIYKLKLRTIIGVIDIWLII